MKYTTKQYASSLLAALDKKSPKEEKEVVRRFLGALQRNGDYAHRAKILEVAERLYFKKNGISKVEVELASDTPANLHKEIESALGRKVVFSDRKNANILGGIKILIDDETLIDASARTQVAKLFQTR